MPIDGERCTVAGMSEHSATEPDWDVVVVGRSYAGLSAALVLGRARRATLVIGEGGPRNGAVAHTNGLAGLDHLPPAELTERMERDVERYPTVRLVADRVHEVTTVDSGFGVRFGATATTARSVILATGVNDSPPPIAGLSEHWGRGVYTCPFCDGFENADRSWAYVVAGGEAAPEAAMFRAVATNWTDDATVVDEAHVVRVHGSGDRVTGIELADGTRREVGAVFVAPCFRPNNQLAVALGADVDDRGFVVVDEMRRTSVPGLLAAGDLTTPRHQVVAALADGAAAAAAVCHP